MVAEPFFSVTAAVTPMAQGNVVAEPVANSPVPMAATTIVGSPMIEVDEELKPVFQEPITNHEEEQQSLPYRMCHTMNLLEDLREPEDRLSLMTMRFMLAKKFKWREIPPPLKKP
jgi:hypothetical protein